MDCELIYGLLKNGTYAVIDYEGQPIDITIPSTHNGKDVTVIDDWVFECCDSLESVTIPGSVKRIGDAAFSSCGNLTSVIIGDGVEDIGNEAFWDCSSLREVTIPGSVTSIGDYVFSGCNNLIEVVILNGVKYIGTEMFSSCYNLTNISIPDSVIRIDDYAFYDCYSLTNVKLPNDLKQIDDGAFCGCEDLMNINIPDSIVYVGSEVFTGCYALLGNIKDGLEYLGNNNNLYLYLTGPTDNNIITASIDERCKIIGSNAFEDCSRLTEVVIPDGLMSIGYTAFEGCYQLTNVKMGSGVTSIGDFAFCYCVNLKNIELPNRITDIGFSTFENSGLIDIVIPDSVVSIYEYAFSECADLKSVKIGSGVKSIGDCAFYSCESLKEITIPDNVIDLGEEAFSYCSNLKNVVISRGVETLSGYEDYEYDEDLDEDVVTGYYGVFAGCENLENVIIRGSGLDIGSGAFYGCKNLISIVLLGNKFRYIPRDAFADTNTDFKFYCRSASINAYTKTASWLVDRIVADDFKLYFIMNAQAEKEYFVSKDQVQSIENSLQSQINGVLDRLNDSIVTITHEELKHLRDNAELISGQFYCITDYECATIQEETKAANNNFNIIVQALAEDQLSENAMATKKQLIPGSVQGYYNIFEDCGFSELPDEEPIDYIRLKDLDFIAYDYLLNRDGVRVPVIYKTKKSGEGYSYNQGVDYEDQFFYIGITEVDGEMYDQWRKIENDEFGHGWESNAKMYVLTNRIVENNILSDRVITKSSLSWEVKYCLDNDKTRFIWADDSQYIINVESMESNGTPLSRAKDFDDKNQWIDIAPEYRYAWGTQADIDDGDNTFFVFSKTWHLENGDLVITPDGEFVPVEVKQLGKGVIYHMKDEWGNEAPYDFKNILFKRPISFDEYGYVKYDSDNGEETWLYTFTAYDIDNKTFLDASSITGRDLLDDSTQLCYGNKIQPCRCAGYASNQLDATMQLNNIVFINNFSQVEAEKFYCYGNSFGTDCRQNTFGDCCYNNMFGNECMNNTFGIECYNNTFGNMCYDNILDDYCSENILSMHCYSNTFGEYCNGNILHPYVCDNILGNENCCITFNHVCQGNVFGGFCSDITLGNGCSNNVFGSDHNFITLGNNCSNIVFSEKEGEILQNVCMITIGDDCRHIKLLANNNSGSEGMLQHITISSGIQGKYDDQKIITLQRTKDVSPVIYESSNTTHIILD